LARRAADASSERRRLRCVPYAPLEDASVLRGSLALLASCLPADQVCLAVIAGGVALTIAYIWRWTRRAAAVGVQTLEDYRGRGNATSVVAAWGRAIQLSGRVPLYGHAWANQTSEAVARRLQLILVGDEVTLT
jgi:hypothetical protein